MLLKVGSKGDDVKKLQEKLKLNADGDFGVMTEQAVKKWQSDNGLTADGIVGDKTWERLFQKPVLKEDTVITKVVGLNLDKLKGHIPDTVLSQIPETAQKFNITTNLRLAHFLSQCAHESGGFDAVNENLNYSAAGLRKIFGKYFPGTLAESYARQPEKIASRVYADRMGNGNEASKEGWKYRGAGYIQMTGKDNYIKLGKFLGVDLVSNPELVATKYPLASAAFFFDVNNVWKVCDLGSSDDVVKQVTKKINGGYNGLDDRQKWFDKIWNVLK